MDEQIGKITVKKIKEVCVKPGANLCYFRRLSFYITLPLLYTHITPNQLTWLWVFLGIASAPFFYFGNYWLSLIGAGLGTFAFLLDHCDGNIARYKKIYSKKGYYVDEIGTFVLMSAILVMIGFGGWNKTGQIWWIFLGAGSMFSYLIYQISILFKELKQKTGEQKEVKAEEKSPKLYKRYNILRKLLPGHLDEIFYIMMVLAIVGYVEWLLVYFFVVYTGMWVGKFVYDYKYSFEN